jgi:hypothetical protein
MSLRPVSQVRSQWIPQQAGTLCGAISCNPIPFSQSRFRNCQRGSESAPRKYTLRCAASGESEDPVADVTPQAVSSASEIGGAASIKVCTCSIWVEPGDYYCALLTYGCVYRCLELEEEDQMRSIECFPQTVLLG